MKQFKLKEVSDSDDTIFYTLSRSPKYFSNVSFHLMFPYAAHVCILSFLYLQILISSTLCNNKKNENN